MYPRTLRAPRAPRARLSFVLKTLLLFSCMTAMSWVSYSTRKQIGNVDIVVVERAESLSPGRTAVADEQHQPSPLSFYAYDERLFLAAAYADFRSAKPRVRIVGYANHEFRKVIFCKHNNQSYRAYGRYVNFTNHTIARWRATYFTCVVPGLESLNYVTVGNKDDKLKDMTLPVHGGVSHVQQKRLLGVCVKSAYGALDVYRLAEWMELNKEIGVDRVILYNASVDSSADEALQYYVDRGYLKVVQDTFRSRLESHNSSLKSLFDNFDATRSTGSEPHPQMQLLSLQDCFHRYRHQFEYILVMDLDEVMIPTSVVSLPEMIRSLSAAYPTATSFSFLASSYLEEYGKANPDVAPYLHTLAYTRRSRLSYEQVKSLHSTRDTEVINWHRRLIPDGSFVAVGQRFGWLQHYRRKCKGSSCRDSRWYDDGASRAGRYAYQLQDSVSKVLKVLGLLAA